MPPECPRRNHVTAPHTIKKRCAVALAVVMTTVPVAVAASPAQAASEMRVACAKPRSGELRYVEQVRACAPSERRIAFREDDPIVACAHRGGFVHVVRVASACKRKKHRPSLTLILPDDVRQSFCANKQTGRLRSTRHAPYRRPRPPGRTCKRSEKRVFVAAA